MSAAALQETMRKIAASPTEQDQKQQQPSEVLMSGLELPTANWVCPKVGISFYFLAVSL